MFLAIVGLLALLWWFVDSYYGADGVRVAGVVLGVLGLVLVVIGVGALVQFMAYRMSMQHHDNIFRGLVRFQEADDRGEIARTGANAVASVIKSGNQLDRTVLTMAGRLAAGQTTAIVQADRRAQQQQTVDAEQEFWRVEPRFDVDDNEPHDRIPDGW
jgi:hypothetical protein